MKHPRRKPFDAIPVGPQRCRHVAGYVLDKVRVALLYAADKRNNSLTSDEIRLIINGLNDTPQGDWHFYQQSYEYCSSASRKSEQLGYERRNLLLRLIVGTFEHKFSVNPDEKIVGDMLSRDIIAPIEVVIEMMLGTEYLKKSKAECLSIFNELELALGDAFNWDAFYNDDRAIKVLIETCASIAQNFDDFKSRRVWFINAMNKHISKDIKPDEVGTEFGIKDFNVVMSCMMKKAHSLLQSPDLDVSQSNLICHENIENIENIFRQCQNTFPS